MASQKDTFPYLIHTAHLRVRHCASCCQLRHVHRLLLLLSCLLARLALPPLPLIRQASLLLHLASSLSVLCETPSLLEVFRYVCPEPVLGNRDGHENIETRGRFTPVTRAGCDALPPIPQASAGSLAPSRPPPPSPAAGSARGVQLQENASLFLLSQLFLSLSRACLGKMIIFSIK
jgi:hypothetical protein